MNPTKVDGVVVGIGELLWDCFEDRRLPGGAPANVAFHAAQLGHRGIPCSRIGDDELGRELLDYLESRDLETGFVQLDGGLPTGRVTVDTGDPGHPTFTIHENVAWDALEFDSGLERLMRDASAVCVGTLAQRDPRSRETIRRCLDAAAGAEVVYDVNLRQSWYRREWIESTLDHSTIVKLNIDEVRTLAPLLGGLPAAPGEFARALIERHDVELVCVTRAEEGCLVLTADDSAEVPGLRVAVADAVGAGDAFTAALISARLRRWPLGLTAGFANRVGALVAGRPGAMPALAGEFAELLDAAENGSLD